jgi:ribonuclease T1
MQRATVTFFIFLVAFIAAIATFSSSHARDSAVKSTDFQLILVADLPKQGRETLALIRKGGPFPYSKDGTIFGNRERLLPKQPRGYYKEFTVKTPGSRDRGARRIVCGGETNNPAKSECFYTADHYASFKRIKE